MRLLPKGVLQQPFNNGIGRNITQLKRIIIRYCNLRPDSAGVRDFIEKDLIQYAEKHSDFVIYVKARRYGAASLTGEYLNGNVHQTSLAKMDAQQVKTWLEHYRTRSGNDILMIDKPHYTSHKSIQGTWKPSNKFIDFSYVNK